MDAHGVQEIVQQISPVNNSSGGTEFIHTETHATFDKNLHIGTDVPSSALHAKKIKSAIGEYSQVRANTVATKLGTQVGTLSAQAVDFTSNALRVSKTPSTTLAGGFVELQYDATATPPVGKLATRKVTQAGDAGHVGLWLQPSATGVAVNESVFIGAQKDFVATHSYLANNYMQSDLVVPSSTSADFTDASLQVTATPSLAAMKAYVLSELVAKFPDVVNVDGTANNWQRWRIIFSMAFRQMHLASLGMLQNLLCAKTCTTRKMCKILQISIQKRMCSPIGEVLRCHLWVAPFLIGRIATISSLPARS